MGEVVKEEEPPSKLLPFSKKIGIVLLVNKEMPRDHFYIGAPGVSRNNPDYVAIEVVNTLWTIYVYVK
jgi:hypothetical protein